TAHDDENNSVKDDDTATVQSFAGPGVRTPGFWANPKLGLTFWDGKSGFAKTGDTSFPTKELAPLWAPASTYLLLGGDHNDTWAAGELKISLADALTMINASDKQQGDGRWMLVRDAIATELNLRAGNPGGDPTVDNTPARLLNDAVDWLIKTTKDQ